VKAEQTEWWVKVRTKDGVISWTKETDKLSGKDGLESWRTGQKSLPMGHVNAARVSRGTPFVRIRDSLNGSSPSDRSQA
jgi:hypothetical protein